jgi:hypothetical protein
MALEQDVRGPTISTKKPLGHRRRIRLCREWEVWLGSIMDTARLQARTECTSRRGPAHSSVGPVGTHQEAGAGVVTHR